MAKYPKITKNTSSLKWEKVPGTSVIKTKKGSYSTYIYSDIVNREYEWHVVLPLHGGIALQVIGGKSDTLSKAKKQSEKELKELTGD